MENMIDEKLLLLIQCPLSGQKLRLLPPDSVARINAAIAAGQVRDQSDQRVEESLDQALANESNEYLYPVRGGIPTLVHDQAISMQDDWR